VNDDDAPTITSVTATPSHQLINAKVNITATVTDNINLQEVKVDITGPTGFTPVNTSMILKSGNNYYYNHSYTIVGTYSYYIWAKDTSNNGQKSATYQFEIFAELNITTLEIGWNFISLPFNLSTPKTNLFIICDGIRYTWGQAVANHIVLDFIYNYSRITHGYGDGFLTVLYPGEGYWMYAYSECHLWVTNLTPMVSDNFITHMRIGWNMVGAPINSQIYKANLLVRNETTGTVYTWADAVLGGYVMNDIFGWERTSPQHYFISYVLDPGYCYWIYAYKNCALKASI